MTTPPTATTETAADGAPMQPVDPTRAGDRAPTQPADPPPAQPADPPPAGHRPPTQPADPTPAAGDPPPRAGDRPPLARRLLGGARARILAVVLALLVFTTLASTLALREILFSRVDQRVERSLAQEIEEFRGFAAQARDPRTGERVGGRTRRLFDLFLARDVPDEGETTFTLLSGRPYRSNADVGTSEQLLASVRALGGVRSVTRGEVATPAGRIRYLAVPIAGGRPPGTFVVTANVGAERAQVTEAVRAAAGVALAVLIVAAILAFLALGRVLAPLRDLGSTARSISTGDELTRRIEVRGHDEIAELARTFNAMLDRLERTFASQRALVSDAGHELRTPITIMRGHLERLAEDPDRRRAESIEIVADELDRMSRLVDDLLLLAKSERPDFLERKPLDLDLLTDELAAKARALGDREWTVEARAIGTVDADRQRLTQAVMNLARNAVEHTEPGARIALGSALQGNSARIWVSDDGPGVPDTDRERIFERFARGSRPASRDGHGLGLAIAQAVAQAHGGRAELLDPAGRGATFAIVLPVEAGPPPIEPDGAAR